MWCDAGSPSSGVLHQLKLASKHRYKYDVRRLKRQQSHFRRRRMAEARLLLVPALVISGMK